jgi:hypothetical protein
MAYLGMHRRESVLAVVLIGLLLGMELGASLSHTAGALENRAEVNRQPRIRRSRAHALNEDEVEQLEATGDFGFVV